MIRPNHQRGGDIAIIGGAVVDAGDAAFVPGAVIQQRFDDVRLNPELGHARRHGSPDVMDTPGLERPALCLDDARAQPQRRIAPGTESLAAAAEDELTAFPTGSGAKQLNSSRREDQRQWMMVFRPGARDLQGSGIKIEFAPTEPADF